MTKKLNIHTFKNINQVTQQWKFKMSKKSDA